MGRQQNDMIVSAFFFLSGKKNLAKVSFINEREINKTTRPGNHPLEDLSEGDLSRVFRSKQKDHNEYHNNRLHEKLTGKADIESMSEYTTSITKASK